jgi:hypothetical protein
MGMTSTATKLIKRFGQAATLVKPSEGPTEPQNPWDEPGEGVSTSHLVTVAVTEYSVEDMDGTLIGVSDLRVFMAVSDVVPLKSDTLVIGGKSYQIKRVGILGPDGVTICYDMQVTA